MDDLISRQEAIDAAIKADMENNSNVLSEKRARVIDRHISAVPSAQPETHDKRTKTHSCDCISRQAAIDAFYKHPNIDWTTLDILAKINALPSAQPEHTNSCYTNSWCIDCKEYDTENKCCPRYNRVIKQTLDDAYRHGETEAEARFHDEIVRCKDCKHWMPHSQLGYDEDNETYHDYCKNLIPEDEYYAFYRNADDYCSRAERRTDVDANT